jgi:hypothetical protein
MREGAEETSLLLLFQGKDTPEKVPS